MARVSLAFLWHFHQPYYKDLRSGKILMPWVRLHGVKDYTGMARLLKEFPKIHCTANFSPSLLSQLQDYGRGGTDVDLELARKPARELSESERHAMARRFFHAHPEHMIRAFPRYAELQETFASADHTPSPQELLDLQVLANLVWFHPTLVRDSAELERLRTRGRNFTEADREFVLAAQQKILAEVIPQWGSLQEAGQVEITCSPYYHPILPLLLDMNAARPGLPSCSLPDSSPLLARDAGVHVERAVDLYKTLFGSSPRGMWPSEGSVSVDALKMLAAKGISWVATDEEILARTLGSDYSKEVLYQPHRLTDACDIVFRDRALSDRIGFAYKTWDSAEAANDFVKILEDRSRRTAQDTLVCVICDGENPWEHYRDNGVPFLRQLYTMLSSSKTVQTVTIGEYLSQHPQRRSLSTLHPGSWINADFSIWVGHDEDVRAWKHLIQAREDFEEAEKKAGGPQASWAMARESLFAAEGSDWFWWFGPEFDTPLDQDFDLIFRTHLMNSYSLRGEMPPQVLYAPIKTIRRKGSFQQPWAALQVKVDGKRSDYFEWIGAGHYEVTSETPAMASAMELFTDIYFGFNERSLLLRFDIKSGGDYNAQTRAGTLALHCVKPREQRITLWGRDKPGQVVTEIGTIVEAECPFEFLGCGEGETVEFYIEFQEAGQPIVRHPMSAPLMVQVPSKDIETIYWQA